MRCASCTVALWSSALTSVSMGSRTSLSSLAARVAETQENSLVRNLASNFSFDSFISEESSSTCTWGGGGGGGEEEERPDQFCYNMVERMLPHSVHEEEEGQEGKISSRGANPIGESRLGKTKELRPLRSRGQLIHLWSEDCRRTGWTMLHQKSS